MTKAKTKSLPIDQVIADPECQPRAELNQDAIAEYAEILEKLPPVVCFEDQFDGDNVRYWLAHGFHRYEAHLLRNRRKIKCDVVCGTKRDAVLYALGQNVDHGVRRTNADKRRAVSIVLADPEWSKFSARKIAEICGVSHEFVRKAIDQVSTVDTSSESHAKGSDGKSYARKKLATDDQVEELDSLFEGLSDDEITAFLEPYDVAKLNDLTYSDAAKLIKVWINGKESDEEVPDDPADDPEDDGPSWDDESEPDAPEEPDEPETVEVEFKGGPIRLTPEQSQLYLECEQEIGQIKAAHSQIMKSLRVICKNAARQHFTASGVVEVGYNPRTEEHDIVRSKAYEDLLYKIISAAPYAPCPFCTESGQVKLDCNACRGVGLAPFSAFRDSHAKTKVGNGMFDDAALAAVREKYGK